ncbi:MAG: YfhO family protein, partial [Bacteroidota bacterium]
VVSALFCKPVLEGNVLNQHDNVGWKGMAQNAFEYKDKNGHFPLWNPNLFSGMPNYQVAIEGKSILPDMTKILTLGMPKPINFFFLACICFYILCLSLRIRPVIGMLGALAYAFSTYNPVIVSAGHDTQMLATAFMPLLLAGIINIYEKKYWLGFAITTFAAYQQIGVNHLQVTYYFFLIALLITIPYLVKWIKEKDWKHIGLAGGLTIISALIGVAGNAMVLKTTSEYTKYTMRGGKEIEILGDTVKATKTKGLDTAYAFEYSVGRGETVTFIMPNAFGGYSSNYADEKSHVVKKLVDKGVAEGNAEQVALSMPAYWGKLYTSGPAYLGVIICLLGLIGFVMIKNPIRWGLLAATLLGILMSWGKYMPGFNTFLFEHLPLYNKFRSPAFSQVIPQLTVGISAVLALQQILFGGKLTKQDFKKILYTATGLLALLGIMYMTMSYSSPFDREISQSISQQAQNESLGRAVISGLVADRKALFGGQLLRALGLSLLALAVLFFYFKNRMSGFITSITLLVISTLEITITSHMYFSNDKGPNENKQDKLFVPADEYDSSNFGKTGIDDEILKDKDPNFRVFNMVGTSSGSTFSESRTSYYHKSVGGYHPAKLRIYQDIIEKYLSAKPSPGVLNMLNTKYIIVQDPQSGQPGLITNPDAFGPCWLVKNVQLADDRVASIKAIGNTNLKDTAIVEKSFSGIVTQPQWDSSASISMTKYDPDAIEYEVKSNGPQFAVFSETYYPLGWNAYLDGKKTEYVNVNYILRGMSVPAGKHNIKFVFEPASVKKGKSIMFMASIAVLLALLGGLFMHFRKYFQKAGTSPA